MIDLSKSIKLDSDVDHVNLTYLAGRFDPEEVLDDLGIKVSYTSGDNIMAHCPFTENHKHGDANPSFGYNIEKMCFNCWVCGPGSLLNLIKTQLNITDDKEAERWLLERCSWEKGSLVDITKSMMDKKNEFDFFPEFSMELLDSWRYLHPYLKERGISKEVAIAMNIGYDRDHDAITMPHIFNDKLVGWQIRHLSKCDLCPKHPKYKSSPSFPKKNTLYNYNNLIKQGMGTRAIVVESPMTVLKMQSLGYTDFVATFGSWSKEQIRLLSGCSEILLWPDNDKAGENNLRKVVGFAARLVPVWIVPMVAGEGGDAADLTAQEVKQYLTEIYTPLALYSKGIQMLKYGDKEKIEALSEDEEKTVKEFEVRTGKKLADLNDQEREEFHEELDATKV